MTLTTISALLPAAAVGIFYFGVPALTVMAAAVAGCALCEAISRRALGGPPGAGVGRAALTGLLLGMCLPPASPLWMIATGCAAAIVLDKVVSAGIGCNPFHPALIAVVCLLLAFPGQMTTWSPPLGLFRSPDVAVAAVAPLAALKAELLAGGTATAARDLDLLGALVGRVPGGAGETSALALVLGGTFLVWRRAIGWEVPVAFLAAAAAPAAVFSYFAPVRFPGAGFHLLTGGLLLGAFFMAADRSVAPASSRGRLVFGAGCGLLTWLIRSYSAFPEGAAFAILLMGSLTPLIDRHSRPRNFAETSAEQGAAKGPDARRASPEE